MKKSLVFWVERYFYNPSFFQNILSFLLSPLSYLYCFVMWSRFKSSKPIDFGIPVIGVGNLVVGGSGKTPLVCALASRYDGVAVVLRGYGRKSKGLYVVSDGRKILCDVDISGDEARIYADKLPSAIVIVSEDRKEAIVKAKEMGAKVVFLDDAYSKHNIKKTDILIDVKSKNSFCLPSGPFRERLWSGKEAIVLEEGRDFKRVVSLVNPTKKMSLVTAIARPQRLDAYLPQVVTKNYFEDHHNFTKDEVLEILKRDGSNSLLVTYKDYVKLNSFGLNLSLIELEIEVNEGIFEKISY